MDFMDFTTRLLILLTLTHFRGETVGLFCIKLTFALLRHRWQSSLRRSRRSAAHGLGAVCRNQRGAPHAGGRRNKVCRPQRSRARTGNPLRLETCRSASAEHGHPLAEKRVGRARHIQVVPKIVFVELSGVHYVQEHITK